MNTQESTIPTITRTLPDYIDEVMGYKDRIVFNLDKAKEILEKDPGEIWTHVELSATVGTVWRKKDWDSTEAKYLKSKIEADARVAAHEKFKRAIDLLSEAIKDMIGGGDSPVEKSIHYNLAIKMYREKNYAKIKLLTGIADIEELGEEPIKEQ